MNTISFLTQIIRESITITPAHQARFFKMNPSDYGAHDQFLGITTPTLRKIVKNHGWRVSWEDI